jgi:hypothetical protein
MNKKEAYRIIDKYFRNDNPTEDDEFVFVEACDFIIETENDAETMVHLGGFYYDKQKFDLAEKYYLMADAAGDKWAADGLGFISYYGRTGERDYKKAFHYFSISKKNGNLEAAMKIADMYHNGYGVEKDDDKYKTLLLEIYEKIKDTDQLFDPYPEVAHRLADIFINEGHGEDAVQMLLKGKSFIEQRIRYNPFWGNFIVCRRTITLLYKIIEFDEDDFNIFDLFYVLAKPNKVKFTYHGKQYIIESFFDEGEMRVKCGDKYYKSIENFLTVATFDDKHLYVIEYEDTYFLDIVN